MEFQKITIIKIRKPMKRDINEELQWVGSSLGLFNLRDKDRSCFRIFIELLKKNNRDGLTSDELAYRLNLSRGTIVHHLKKLKSAGLIISKGKKYQMRVDNLDSLVDEVKKDVDRLYEDLKDVAQDIDNKLGL